MTEPEGKVVPSPSPANRPSFFDGPGVKATSFIVGIIGVAFGIWSHFASIKEPAITYVVNSTRTTLVQGGGPSGLTVQFNGEQLAGPVTSVTVGIWNAGRAAVKTSNILDALTLTIPPKNRILSATVLKQSRAIVRFRILPKTGEYAPDMATANTLQFSFNVFEHNDSAVMQIIYEGDPEAKVVLSGAFDGQASVARWRGDPSASSRYGALFVAGLAFALGAVASGSFVHLAKLVSALFSHPRAITKVLPSLNYRVWFFLLLATLFSLSLFAGGLYLMYVYVVQWAPFSFD